MRLVPQTIRGRLIAVLIGGLLLSLAAGVITLVLSQPGHGERGTYPEMVKEIAGYASLVNRTSAGARRPLIEAIDVAGIRFQWSPGERPPRHDDRNRPVRHLQRDLEQVLRLKVVALRRGGPVHVWIKLEDATWLQVSLKDDPFGPYWFLRIILAFAVLVAGIALLSIWAARRVTAPLNQFAAAATRLGTDVEAPPLPETGAREIRQATAAFNQMQRRIRRTVEDRTLTLAAISHDLKTALTRLKLRTEFIDDPEQQKKALADLDEMQAMLEATLAFARDDWLAEDRSELDLAQLLQRLCRDFTEAGKDALYDGPAAFSFGGRPLGLQRAFTNLLDNAVTYGGQAAVHLEQTVGEVIVTISDRGPGIPVEHRERVFAPFQRLEPSRSRETGGTGLGLAVARSLVRRHGGEITLEDRPGGGLVVRVHLPNTNGHSQ